MRAVSFELRIFFPHPTFPTQEWYDILGSFRSDDCYVRFDEPTERAQGGVKECYLIPDVTLHRDDVWIALVLVHIGL